MIRIPFGSPDAAMSIVESTDGGFFVAFDADEPFVAEEPGVAVCVASPETAIHDLRQLMDATASAILELMARAQPSEAAKPEGVN